MTAEALLQCRALEAGYGPVNVVRPFDLTAGEGSVVAVLGPNGAGKTTLLTTMAGLLPAQGGEVLVRGEVLKSGRPAAASKAGIVLVPDDRALFTTLTVKENLKAAKGRRKGSFDQVFELFPALESRRDIHAGALSGGEQQMLAMARALVQDPKVLLVDEMSMGLAPIIVERILPLVRRVADETGAVVVLVEQHVGLALEIADQALVMVHGEVVLDRPATELRGNMDLLEAAYLGETATIGSPDAAPQE